VRPPPIIFVSDPHGHWSEAFFLCTPPATPSFGRPPRAANWAPHVAQGALWRLSEARGPGRSHRERSVTLGVACWALSVTGNKGARPIPPERGGD